MEEDTRDMVNFFHVFQILPGLRLNSFLCHTKKMLYACNIACVPTNLDIWLTHDLVITEMIFILGQRKVRGRWVSSEK